MPIDELEQQIVRCELCPRLRSHCLEIAKTKRKQFLNANYWGKPVPGFGDPFAKLWVIGLAPAAHGANRTGRMFTGDRSGEWLYRALHKAGFANQPNSVSRDDGLQLKSAYISAVNRCAPPDNLPTREEQNNCRVFLNEEREALTQVQVVVALGKIAWDAVIKLYADQAASKKVPFSHGAEMQLSNGILLLASYHPSQQNTFTGRLKEAAFDSVFERARSLLLSHG